jgi:hypothetical protein
MPGQSMNVPDAALLPSDLKGLRLKQSLSGMAGPVRQSLFQFFPRNVGYGRGELFEGQLGRRIEVRVIEAFLECPDYSLHRQSALNGRNVMVFTQNLAPRKDMGSAYINDLAILVPSS